MDNQKEFELILGVKLKPNRIGIAYARCPFHDQDNLSLEIDVREGICYCHAGCGGDMYYGLAERLGKSDVIA